MAAVSRMSNPERVVITAVLAGVLCERIARAQSHGQLLLPEQKPAAVQETLL